MARKASKAKGMGKRRMKDMEGEGFFDDVGNWIKGAANTVYNKAIVPAHDFVKRNKLISRGLALGSQIPGNPYAAYMKVGGPLADRLGYGKNMSGGAQSDARGMVPGEGMLGDIYGEPGLIQESGYTLRARDSPHCEF